MSNTRFGLFNRPAALGALPSGLSFTVLDRPAKGQPHHDYARHGILVPARPITVAEAANSELVRLVEPDEVATFAQRIADEHLAEYASEYLDAAVREPEQFQEQIMELARRGEDGEMYSFPDPESLTRAVQSALRARLTCAAARP